MGTEAMRRRTRPVILLRRKLRVVSKKNPCLHCRDPIKSLAGDTATRGLRTLERFVSALLDKSGGILPSGFVVTLQES